ncbi:unnamed protein product [Kuraishia capsulata CBS 1993]|uniref:Uncharacterized protein n=1 Tax=Kuraishia capsulata CBS 1993 TaxID=1382522 RepID=W6MKK3_9ASCO|nr:uncharacterized protein KUCA_T00001224001 [Kuraishia capsulata CBS 1993]CDK25257.1 unnamed protein product [Kuraishia capsulata CBS 1993]
MILFFVDCIFRLLIPPSLSDQLCRSSSPSPSITFIIFQGRGFSVIFLRKVFVHLCHHHRYFLYICFVCFPYHCITLWERETLTVDLGLEEEHARSKNCFTETLLNGSDLCHSL